jgi:hypothetical protein
MPVGEILDVVVGVADAGSQLAPAKRRGCSLIVYTLTAVAIMLIVCFFISN